jgi:hypothetical protein
MTKRILTIEYRVARFMIAGLALLPIGTKGATPADPDLSLFEASIANNSAYTSVTVAPASFAGLFNGITWPLKTDDPQCSNSAQSSNVCKNISDPLSKNLRDIKIAGSVFVIDDSPLWQSLSGVENIRSLVIEADKVVVRKKLSLPGTNLTINAIDVIVDSAGSVDVTPDSYFVQPPGCLSSTCSAPNDGVDGQSGASITIVAEKVSLHAAQPANAQLIANGGRGQNAGAGFGDTSNMVAKNNRTVDDKMKDLGGGFVYRLQLSVDFMQMPHGGAELCVPHQPPNIQGVQRWPSDGASAVAGGYPGAGGTGGRISVTVNAVDPNGSSSPLVSVQPGASGTPDGDNGDGKRFGHKGGTPNPAYMELDKFNPKPQCSITSTPPASHTSADGKNANGPTAPKNIAASGQSSFTVAANQAGPRATFDRDYFAVKTKLIRDQYINADTPQVEPIDPSYVNPGYTQTAQLIADLEQTFTAQKDLQTALTTDPGLAAEWSKLEVMSNNLKLQKNYFGRGLHDAPIYAFAFAADRFQTQINSMANLLYLSRTFSQSYASRKAATQTDLQSLSNAEAAVIQDETQYEIDSNAITQIGVQLAQVLQTIAQVQSDLASVNAYISSEANMSLAEKNAQLQSLAALQVICAVIPVGQPALGIGAQALGSVIKGPATNDVNGWVQFGSQLGSDFTKLDDPKTWQQVASNWNTLGNNLTGSNAEAGLKTLAGLVKQASDGMKTLKSQPKVSQSDVAAMIQTLEQNNPAWQYLTDEIKNLLKQKADLLASYNSLLGQLSTLLDQVNQSVNLADQSSSLILTSDWTNDPLLSNTYSQMTSSAEDKLLDILDQLENSAGYVTLEHKALEPSFATLLGEVDNDANTQTPANAAILLGSWFTSQKQAIQSAIDDEATKRNGLVLTSSGGVSVLRVGPALIADLNQTGYLEIPLAASMFVNYPNARITKIEMSNDIQSNQINLAPSCRTRSAVTSAPLRVQLDHSGTIMVSGEANDYVYSLTDPFTWDFNLAWDGTKVAITPSSLSNSALSILKSISGDPNVTDDYEEIFAAHAAITTLQISMIGFPNCYQVGKLQLNVDFDYSAQ